MSLLLITTGAITAIAGRHCVPALAIGLGLMFIGWLALDGKKVKR